MSGFQLSSDAAARYDSFVRAAMEPWIDDLILAARCKEGDRVLDVACGTGFIAKRVNGASGVTCKITGIDLNEPMLNIARQEPAIDWRLGSAIAMPFPDGSFDVVLCQQGLQFFPDRQAAMREMARVLSPGGRLSLNVWGPLERQVFFKTLFDAVSMLLGGDAAKAIASPYTLTTREELRALASGAGFNDVTVRFEHRTIRAHDVVGYARGIIQVTPMAGEFLALPDDEKARFGAYMTDRLASYVDDAGMAVPQENHFLFAVR